MEMLAGSNENAWPKIKKQKSYNLLKMTITAAEIFHWKMVGCVLCDNNDSLMQIKRISMI